MNTYFIAATAALAALAVAPANAKNGSWPIGNDQYHIYYSDLDMNSSAGRAAMLARVEKAATKLCADLVDRRECVTATIAQASHAAGGSALQLALRERGAVRFASR